MYRDTLLVTGSGGLVGGYAVDHYCKKGAKVYGIDNNGRGTYFGASASTEWRIRQLESNHSNFENFKIDIRDKQSIKELISKTLPETVIHTAGQPSHDFAAHNPHLDFEVNAAGTLNLLEACKEYVPDSNIIVFSTNKVYGDSVNEIPWEEGASRFEFRGSHFKKGVDEIQRLDQSNHSLFGVSKLYADVIAQEYGRNFEMKTTILRGGCLTGPNHSATESHGFLSFMVSKAVKKLPYQVFGFCGKQVRDNLHVEDIVLLIDKIIESPNYGEVFNLGGGYENSVSILEVIDKLYENHNLQLKTELIAQERFGDHRIYYSCLDKLMNRYSNWSVTRDLDDILDNLIGDWKLRIDN